MSLTTLENASRAQERDRPGINATAAGGSEDCRVRARRDNDFTAAWAAAQVTIAILERLLDDPTDPDALAAAQRHLNDNPHWTRRARLFMAAQPD